MKKETYPMNLIVKLLSLSLMLLIVGFKCPVLHQEEYSVKCLVDFEDNSISTLDSIYLIKSVDLSDEKFQFYVNADEIYIKKYQFGKSNGIDISNLIEEKEKLFLRIEVVKKGDKLYKIPLKYEKTYIKDEVYKKDTLSPEFY